MRGITTLVLLMFISGYYLHLDTRRSMYRTDLSYQKATRGLENNLFTEMLTRLPEQNETGVNNLSAATALVTNTSKVGKAGLRIPLLAAGAYSPLDDDGKKQTAYLRPL